MSKAFISAAEQSAHDPNEGIPFTLDGDELVAYYPGDGQVGVLMAETGKHTTTQTKVAGAIDFFQSVFDDEDSTYLRGRLLDRKDDFGLKEVQEIIQWLIEEWSANPTVAASASTRSPVTTGTASKPRTRARTSSRSA